jgi:hypothetical protein
MQKMRSSPRFTYVFIGLLLVVMFAGASYGQDPVPQTMASATPDLSAVKLPQDVNVTQGGVVTFSPNMILDETGLVVSGGAANVSVNTAAGIGGGNDDHLVNGEVRHTPPGGNIDGLNTIATFDGAFAAQAGPSQGLVFKFTMIGNHPLAGDTTVIPMRASEISWQLLNADGTVNQTVSYAPFEKLTLESPNFEPLDYRSGHHIEFADAVHRAQFFNRMARDWHTVLVPHISNRVTITVPFFVNVQLGNGTIVQARSYFTGKAADGSTFVLMLSPLFNFFFDNEVVNEINLGNFTTNALNEVWTPNTFLFNLNANNPNVPGGCCVLGFHTFFRDGAVPQDRWVSLFQSWISPGIFGGGFQDVTAMSHETAEAFANPFVNNAAPNWQFPGQPPTSKACQANLEEGDPIEVLANATAPTEVKEGKFQFIYHPQNIPLLQWFEMGPTSNAIDGAFSFPDETVLPHSAIPCPQ